MAGRIRTIKPEINEDEKAQALPDEAWRLWVSMWVIADDLGRLPASPAYLGGRIFWGKPNPAESASRALASLREASMILIYRVRGETYCQITGWSKHQKIDKPSGAKFPGPNEPLGQLTHPTLANPRESSRILDPDHDHDLDQEPAGVDQTDRLEGEGSNQSDPPDAGGDAQTTFGADFAQDEGNEVGVGRESPEPPIVRLVANGEAPRRAKSKAAEPRIVPEEASTLAHLLVAYVCSSNPDGRMARKSDREKEAAAERWAVPIEQLHRIDKQAWGTIEGVIHWTFKDPFWRGIIQGGENLRAKWSTLTAQRLRTKPTAAAVRKGPTSLAIDEIRALEEAEAADVGRTG